MAAAKHFVVSKARAVLDVHKGVERGREEVTCDAEAINNASVSGWEEDRVRLVYVAFCQTHEGIVERLVRRT